MSSVLASTKSVRSSGQLNLVRARPARSTTWSSCRYNSTTQSTRTTDAVVTWPEYLTIRRAKRRWETAVTIPSSLLGFMGGISYFGSLDIDVTKPVMGIDPMFFYGGCSVACAGLGYLIGPSIGAAVWRLRHRQMMHLFEARDREFYQHIVKHRVDPTSQSATNPVPDYHGEKIGSLHQYRQWLRDQSRFKRKAMLPEE